MLESLWNDEETQALKVGLAEGLTDLELASRCGRTEYAIQRKRYRLGFIRSQDRSTWSIWTEARIERLKELAALNWSYGKIAADMGMTRSAIIGKADRLGLPSRKKPTIGANRKPRIRSSTPRKNPFTWKRHPSWKREFFKFPDLQIAAVPLHIKLTDLESHHCRYPLDTKDDDGLILYCGNPKHGNESWCIGHCRICFAPPNGPKRGHSFRIFK